MMESSARTRRHLLWAAPGMALSGLFFGAGGAAAGLVMWIAGSLLLSGRKGQTQLYPKQRRMKPHRLLLGYSFCVCCLAFLNTAGNRILGGSMSVISGFLLLLGSIGFSLALGVWAMQWPLHGRTELFLSMIFLMLFFFFLLRP